MNHQEPQPVKVALDYCVANGLDMWRQNCPTINRSALVNQILLEWLKSKQVWGSDAA